MHIMHVCWVELVGLVDPVDGLALVCVTVLAQYLKNRGEKLFSKRKF